MSSIEWDASAFDVHLRAMAAAADDATRDAVVEGAALIERKMKELSSGRPGPNVQSGAHRRGIIVSGPKRYGGSTRLGSSWWRADIGPTMVYSRRLELGGGNWPAGTKFPYAGPAMDWARSGPIGEVFDRYYARVHR